MSLSDLNNIAGGSHAGASPSGRSSAALEADLAAAKKTISKFNAERLIYILIFAIVWDAHTFKAFQSWAPTAAILFLELIIFFILAYRLELHEVVQLFWSLMKTYGKGDPGSVPSTPEDSAVAKPPP